MSARQLSAGICMRLRDALPNEISTFGTGHSVQLLSIKTISQQTSTANIDRYCVVISDGVHFTPAMLATQLNELVSGGDVVQNSIVVIDKLACNFVQNKRIIMIHDFHIVSRDEEIIGNPVAVPGSSTAAPNSLAETSGSSTSSAPQPSAFSSQPAAAHSGSNVPVGQGRSIYPIEGLNPYQNDWTIKARVTRKSDIRTWTNQRGEGKLFSVTLMDETGEISATAFNAVVDGLYDKLEEGRVYYISKARVNPAKGKFSSVQNIYEMNLEKNTAVEECLDAVNLPMIRYNFIPLASLEQLQKDATCDVIAIIKEVGPLGEVVSKATNRSVAKCELTIVDNTLYSVRMTIWGRQAETFTADDFPVVVFKGVKVGDFGGRNLSMLSSSSMTINPDIEEAHLLRGWYDGFGADKTFQSYSNITPSGGSSFGGFNRTEMRYLRDVKELQLDKTEYFSACATVMHIRQESIAYPGCPTCAKKVTDMGNGWRCERCEKTSERPEYRYNLSMAVSDWSAQIWLQAFNEVGLAVFGKTADELMEIKDRDDSEFAAVLAQVTGKTYNFSFRARRDTYNNQIRMRYDISKINPVDYHEEAKHLRDLLMESDWAMAGI